MVVVAVTAVVMVVVRIKPESGRMFSCIIIASGCC